LISTPTLTLNGFLLVLRTRRSLMLENLALRHQLAVLQRSSPRPRLRTFDRVFWVLLGRMSTLTFKVLFVFVGTRGWLRKILPGCIGHAEVSQCVRLAVLGLPPLWV